MSWNRVGSDVDESKGSPVVEARVASLNFFKRRLSEMGCDDSQSNHMGEIKVWEDTQEEKEESKEI